MIPPGNANTADAATLERRCLLAWAEPDLDAWQDVNTCRACDGSGIQPGPFEGSDDQPCSACDGEGET
jgi:hypothetical protein